MSDTLKRAAAMLLAEANAIEDCHTRGDGDWTGEDEAKASHDAMREVAILLGEEAERMAEQAFFLKAAQAESERYCEQRDNLLRVLQHITCEPINAEYMAQEAIDAIVADEINEANGGAVC
jgi:hypothetical protein